MRGNERGKKRKEEKRGQGSGKGMRVDERGGCRREDWDVGAAVRRFSPW